jgi:CBS-domain-containing membrane protein
LDQYLYSTLTLKSVFITLYGIVTGQSGYHLWFLYTLLMLYVAVPVLDQEGVYIGTLRNDDIFRYFRDSGSFDYRAAEQDTVTSIIDPSYARPLYHTASFDQIIESVSEHNIVSIVDDRGCFIGMILRRDVLNFLSEHYKKTAK